MTFARRMCQFSPAIVLFVWALVGITGLEDEAVTAMFRVLFGLTLILHIRMEWNARRNGNGRRSPRVGH